MAKRSSAVRGTAGSICRGLTQPSCECAGRYGRVSIGGLGRDHEQGREKRYERHRLWRAKSREGSGTRDPVAVSIIPNCVSGWSVWKCTFFSKLVVNISTSVSTVKLCTAARYPTRFCMNLGLLMTSSTWKLAQDMSWPNISR